MAKSKAERGRFFSRKKMEVVLQVLRGEDLDLVSREAGITAATLSAWREHFVTSGQAGLKSRAADGRDAELVRLKTLVGISRCGSNCPVKQSAHCGLAPLCSPGGRRDGHATSPSVHRPYGVVRVCQEWGLSRATFYHQQGRIARPPLKPAKRGPKTASTDEALTGHIRAVITTSPFLGEGHRKVWVRLRTQGIGTSKPRVLRLMRQDALLAPSRAQRVMGPRSHEGTITTARPNQMWGTDATSTVTLEDL